jgi:tetratricopeptide (TPR) repeat protein
MAKKLNKKVAIISVVLLIVVVGGGLGWLVGPKVARRYGLFQDPDKSLAKARQLLEAGDYKNAEKEFGSAYTYGKTDEYKVDRLFELADFHLIRNDRHEPDWGKAIRCWNTILSKYDAQNIPARRSLVDFYYQAAEAGDARSWRSVNENTTKLLEVLKDQGAEPDVFLQKAYAESLLAIARRGETTNRRELLDKSMKELSELLEKEPHDESLYKLMADAITVDGELNALAGVVGSSKTAQGKAVGLLETGIEQAGDKATALANLFFYKMQTASPNDPNLLEAIRAEIDERSKEVQPNDKLWLVTSIVYETPGKMPAKAEINRAIEAIRQAHELKPEDFEYTLRLSRLMYRKANIFNDQAALEDALQIAEGALSMEEVQNIPGPLQGRNLNYRFTLNNYLAELYLEKAIAAKDAGEDVQLKDAIQKAEERLKELYSALGTTDNPTGLKFEGMLALAKGQQDKAVRLLYDAYEKNKALDVPGEASNVDSRVCMLLAKIAGQEGQLGLQAEFLQGALASGDRYFLQKPQLFLEYAGLINQLRSFREWPGAIMQFVKNYENLSGEDTQSRILTIEALIAMRQFDKATELLASFDDTPELKLSYELIIAAAQVNQLKQTIAGLQEEKKEPTAEQAGEMETLRVRRDTLLEQCLSRYPKEIKPQLLSSICLDLMQNEQSSRAVGYLDTYLAANPDVVGLMVLRLQAQQKDPLNLTFEQRDALQEQAIQSVGDPKQRALLMAERYRSSGEYEKALKALEENAQVDRDDPDIIQARFGIVLEQKDFNVAETLLPVIREKNLDLCEGNLAAARLEFVKENYKLALERMEECIKQRPLSSYNYFLKSQVQRQLKDEEGALESVRTAVRMNPQSPVYSRILASMLFERNAALGSKVTPEQRKEAEQAVYMAISLNPTDEQLQSVYAESIFLHSPDQALAIRQELLKTNPTVGNALMLGNMALRMAQSEWQAAKKDSLIELAGKAYQQGMEIDPNDEILLQTYADYQQKSGKGADALTLLKGDKNLEWKFYLRNGQFEQAETVLKELLRETPDDSQLVQGLVLVSQGAGKRDEVKRYLDMLTQRDDTKETELWILQKYIDNGFTAEAEKNLASFKERYPDEKAALLVEAWTEMGKGRLDEALTLTNRYLETDTNNPGAWRLRGRLYRLMNQPRKAIDDLQRSKGLQDSFAVRMELATVYNEMNQPTAAIGELVSSLDDPQAPVQVRLMLEGLYQQNKRTSDLEKLYDSTLEKYPQSVFWYYRVGRYYLSRGNLGKAQPLLETSWQMSQQQNRPDINVLGAYLESLFKNAQYDQVFSIASGIIDSSAAPLAYTFMAQVQIQKGQKDKALESYYTALDKTGTNDGVQEMIMQKMLDTVGEDAVTGWISKTLAENANSLPAYLLAARLAQNDSSYNKAIEHIDKCIEIVGAQSPAWMGYALKKVNLHIMAYVKTGDRGYMTQAMDLLGHMLQLQPNNSSLLNNMAYLLADNDQQLETALEYARRAFQSDPGNVVYLDTYAYTQCKTGQYKQAEQNLIRALQIYEVSGQAVPWDLYKHFGMVKEGLADTKVAIEMYQKAMAASDQMPENEKQQIQQAIERLEKSKEN